MPTITSQDASLRDQMFKDVKFWVAHRVPMRQYFINKIEESGGTVVPLEKNADILIADHARKDAPPGSYSWKLIEDSVKHGVAQLKDRYAIGPDPVKPRPVASGGPSRSGRTEFTAEDDASLVRWVLSYNKHRTGNIIYQQLEQENPRHTWQSWQNRWRKKLQYYTPTQLARIAAHVSEAAEPEDELEHPSPPPPRAPPPRQLQPLKRRKDSSAPQSSAVPASTPAPARRQPQTRNTSPSPWDVPSSAEAGPSSRRGRDQKSPPLARSPHNHNYDIQEPEVPTQDSSSDRSRSPIEPNLVPKSQSKPNSSSDQSMDMFYDDLHEYMNLANPNINLEPIIGNKQLDLWQLAEAVGSQNVDIDNVDWEQVANHLGYDDSNQSLLDQLLECWEANLRDFLDFMEEFDKAQQDAAPSADSDHEALVNIVGEEEDEQTIIPSTVEEDNDAEPRLPSLALPSWATKKRPFEASPLAAANTFVKRRRLAPDAVVPSTPEELIGIPASVSGKPQQSPSLIRSQRMLRQRHLNLDDTIKDSQDDTQDRLQSPPRATGARSPELGSFEVSTPVLQRIESAYDITPSQQLESEAESPLARAGKRVTITVPHDEPEDEVQSSHQHSPSPQPAASSLHVAKRRALPSSFRNSSAPSASQASAQTESVRRHSTALKTTQRQDQGRRALSRGNPPSMARKPSSIPEWAEHYESLGYPRATVNKAMLATTMNPGTLVVTVLESLTQGGGIPPNHAGIWTDRDDGGIHLLLHAGDDLGRAPLDIEEELMLKRARKEEGRLLRKHGELWTATRKQYWVEKNAFEAKKRKKKELKMLMEQTENRSDTSM